MKRTDKDSRELKRNSVKHANYFLNQYFSALEKGNQYSIDHFKLTGKHLHLRPGIIQESKINNKNRRVLILKRELKPGGTYDELNIPIKKGDYALTTVEERQWYYCSEYFSKSDTKKSKYFNINTPLEMTHKGVRYIDLEIDVIQSNSEERFIVDRNRLKHAFRLGIISESLYNKAKNIAQDLLNKN
jgi:protein associated with RNAse G/E